MSTGTPSAALAGRDLGATAIEVFGAALGQLVDLVLEEVVGAIDDLLLDGDALLRLELIDQFLHRLRRRHAVLVAVDDEARRRAGREEREIVEVLGRRDGDEALD